MVRYYKIHTKDGKKYRLIKYNKITYEGHEVDIKRPFDDMGDEITFNPDNIIAVQECYGHPIYD